MVAKIKYSFDDNVRGWLHGYIGDFFPHNNVRRIHSKGNLVTHVYSRQTLRLFQKLEGDVKSYFVTIPAGSELVAFHDAYFDKKTEVIATIIIPEHGQYSFKSSGVVVYTDYKELKKQSGSWPKSRPRRGVSYDSE